MRKSSPLRRIFWGPFWGVLAGAAFYGTGFALYVALLPKPFTTVPANTEALAVFSGGTGRIEAALRIIEQGFKGPVLISGLHPDTRLADILSHTSSGPDITPAQREQIMLDTAESTAENMQSLKLWAATTNSTEVAVITSSYHAARVRFLGWWQAPELHLSVLAIQPENPRFNVLLREYHKLLATPFLR